MRRRLALRAAAAAALALGAAAQRPYTCLNSTVAGFAMCNASLPVAERVADLMARLSALNDTYKFALLSSWDGAAHVPQLAIPGYQWWSEALHGLARSPGVHFLHTPTPYATMFPEPSFTGCSFNTSLYRAIGEAIADDARIFNNNGNAGLTYWSPNVNPFRDPRWGRGQEVAGGEDPFAISMYARQFVRGLQEGEDPRYLKVSSCCKHFVAYDLESWNGTGRDAYNAVVSDADLAEYYTPTFQTCVQDARVSSLMCSYNALNGVPTCASSFLLTEIARGEWGFNGYITSDCEACEDVQKAHHYTNSSDETCAVLTTSGMDTCCSAYLPPNLPHAVASGAVQMSDVDTMLSNLFAVKMRLGFYDDPAQQPYTSIPLERLCSKQALSLDAARQALVLLKNAGGALPLSAAAVKSVAVVGPNGDSAENAEGNYFGVPCSSAAWNEPLIYTIRQGFGAYLPPSAVAFAPGCDDGVPCTKTAGFANASAAAAAADLTVVVVGLDQGQESEGNDRDAIGLPGNQSALVAQTCAAARGPCVLVVMTGGPVDISAELANPKVTGALFVGYPGPFGGNATAQAIFGDLAPAGRLTTTIYPKAFVDEVSFFDQGLAPGPSAFPPGTNPGRTHMYYTGQAVLPFGWGLSYTTWAYAVDSVLGLASPAASMLPRLSLAPVHEYLAAHPRHGAMFAPLTWRELVQYRVNVTNTGSVDSDDVVLGFLVPPGAGQNGVPLQTLFGFARVFVPAGGTVQVWLGVEARSLTRIVRGSGRRVAAPGLYTVRVGVAFNRGGALEVPSALAEHSFVADA